MLSQFGRYTSELFMNERESNEVTAKESEILIETNGSEDLAEKSADEKDEQIEDAP
jgi:hypothetical protein